MGLFRPQEKERGALTLPRIYRPDMTDGETAIEADGKDFHYLKSVLRLCEGSEIHLFNGQGDSWRAVIEHYAGQRASLRILKKEERAAPPVDVTLAQSLPKSDKMDFIVQKGTELGVGRIIPFLSSRSVPRPDTGRQENRLRRWRRIAAEASRQCGRSSVPEITDIITFDEMLEHRRETVLGLLFWEGERERSLKSLLRGESARERSSFFIVVGPEGGFSRDETDRALSSGMLTVTLGPYILRTETAPLAILSILQYERGSLSERTSHG